MRSGGPTPTPWFSTMSNHSFQHQKNAHSVQVFTMLCFQTISKAKDCPSQLGRINSTGALNAYSQTEKTINMAVTFELPPQIHNGPQFSRLRRSPSPHPRATRAKPKSSVKKVVEAVKNHLYLPRGTIKHLLLYGPHYSEIFPRRYPVDHQSRLKASRMKDKNRYYEIGLYVHEEESDDESKGSYGSIEDDAGLDSGVDMYEEEALEQFHVVKDGSACAWWKASV
ncbi:uncharacterized protein M421DRAFT_129167 [Didymella exigua CBS 183.55]|uniref:Uncharacterized protein n=1 Tax=Didymella exigua CBS 183.55 TaxID=1150837 RepID=A0A6A5RQ21_9PLEO|nr:uncharacterized protein M421DRAFT_129167 [Didymella exigua CBS 183.55]KAF1929769.1 hypothetical protein M421DRAFT_129167 [Didymella exigua CBS 183.55]